MGRAGWIASSFGVFAFFALTIIDCVGDAPAAGGGEEAGAGDATTNSDASTDGGNVGADAGDGATAIDPCAGEPAGCAGAVDPTHLKLWLRGDTGVDCVGGRVVTWHDLSGNAHDATPAAYPDGGLALSPQCGADNLNGHPVVSFTRPATSGTFVLDETLQLDLSFFADSSYTAFIVYDPDYISDLGLIASDHPQPL